MSGQGDKHTEGWTYLTLLNPCGYDRESQKCCTKVKKNHYQENLFLYFHICWKKNTYLPITACGPYLSLKILDLKKILIILTCD